ncbi:hypothetical protein O181_039635 [Austropuccinia psidii MF-1]|uniref:DUF4939 domain-containing protein n=1 Tax=Austropuccinia psidii MF-1 TaxID=1389203 RepID=A0A9Q3DBV7_9BASI|nr:hypothetical protein [Austropuccinia psidii MF-1]
MEWDAIARKEGRGLRRSRSFHRVFSTFAGMSKHFLKVLGEYGEEEVSDGTEVAPAPVGPTLDQSNLPDQMLLAIMQKKASDYCRFPENSSSKASRLLLLDSILQSQKLYLSLPTYFSKLPGKFLYATSFLTGRAAKWLEPYLSNLTN